MEFRDITHRYYIYRGGNPNTCHIHLKKPGLFAFLASFWRRSLRALYPPSLMSWPKTARISAASSFRTQPAIPCIILSSLALIDIMTGFIHCLLNKKSEYVSEFWIMYLTQTWIIYPLKTKKHNRFPIQDICIYIYTLPFWNKMGVWYQSAAKQTKKSQALPPQQVLQ